MNLTESCHVRTEALDYRADALAMVGQLFYDPGAADPRPAILLFPDILGLGSHIKDRAERLVLERGYVALACDLHGQQKVFSSLEDAQALVQTWRRDVKTIRARTVGALDALCARPEVDQTRVAAMGFCLGGTLAFELALAGVELKAAVGFHSGLVLSSPQEAKSIKAKILAIQGADDPLSPVDQRNAFEATLREGGVDWQMYLYGGVLHSFTNPDADALGYLKISRYDRSADVRSWKQAHEFLDEAFAMP